ncbi:ComEC/Rec2 family competence protein [uncultured Sphingomonas sp.]|uniref:ComEC/Rec2 family competence protein n=1 Tax=uncultured Sphingomonas sp. TaxID=158754 RepID=UPI0025F12AAC|nr:ComEC/Rec2 family competence protein [uncultured Sphingomonas sp.]
MRNIRPRLEQWLEAERDQLALWLPVGLGAGIAAWFGLPDARAWQIFLLLTSAVAAALLAIDRGGRATRAAAIFMVAMVTGCLLASGRSSHVAAPVLTRPAMFALEGRVESIQRLPARNLVRLVLVSRPQPGLPPRVRVNVDQAAMPPAIRGGATVRLRARLVPPPPPALPGAYDFARVAWFKRLGATGKALGPVATVAPAPAGTGFSGWVEDCRTALTGHIQSRLAGSEGGIAASLVTGDTGAIDDADADAMRRSGLAHLLSISGLHVTAVVGAAMLLTLRLLALSRWMALRTPLLLIAAGAGALAGIAYTLLSGAEVPTVRSCVAALLVLGGIALGREAVTLRLVAAGAMTVLLLWPEAVVGPSFQLSFAAVIAIIAFHDHPRVRALALKRDEPWFAKAGRELVSLLATGLLVEAALAPIAAYHFHRAGLYGAAANVVAIPLTTFVVMPLEAVALLLDSVGLGDPVWWMAGQGLRLLLAIAHCVSAAPGAVAALPSMPTAAFLLMTGGGLWLALWRTRMRRLAWIPLTAGAAWALATPAPDLLVTGDGRHLAVREGEALYLLRPRAGDFVREQVSAGSGVQDDALDLATLPGARCSRDACVASIRRGGRSWRILATRSPYFLDWPGFVASCRWADIVVSDRRLPRACAPRWLKLDGPALRDTGGVAIDLPAGTIRTVIGADRHPWVVRPAIRP